MAHSIFVFAHPDDEFGCYESIRLEISYGHQVACFFLTDGGYGGQNIKKRMAESTRILTSLGVASNGIHFIGVDVGIPDGGLQDWMFDAACKMTKHINRLDVITRIYAPAWEGGHQDHDAAHVIALRLSREWVLQDGIWQYSLYHGKGLPGPFFHVLLPLSENGEYVIQRLPLSRRFAYIGFCLSYASQWKTWLGLFPFVAYRLLFNGCYRLQRAVILDRFSRPHSGKLLYERRTRIKFDDMRVKFMDFDTRWGRP